VLAVIGVEPDALAADMDWPLVPSTAANLQAAPACWPPEKRSIDGRELIGVWNFDLGLFVTPTGPLPDLRLERWVQESDRDVYRIVAPNDLFLTTSRTVAVLEVHRRAGRPLFRWKDGSLVRLGRSGHLPLPAARALRRRTLTPSGPITDAQGAWTYGYPADAASAKWIATVFGAAVDAPRMIGGESRLRALIARRRSGLPPTWWLPEFDRSERRA
jgi:hypothetical protein